MLSISKLSKRERRIALISALLLAVIFFDRMVFSPVMKKLDKLNGEIAIQEKKLVKSMRILSQEEQIRDEYGKYTQDIKQDRSNEEAIAVFLSSVEKMANDSFVSLVDMKPSSVESEDFYNKYTVRIEAKADIGYLADFIYQLEKSSWLFRVSELRLVPKKRESSVLRISITITQILLSDTA